MLIFWFAPIQNRTWQSSVTLQLHIHNTSLTSLSSSSGSPQIIIIRTIAANSKWSDRNVWFFFKTVLLLYLYFSNLSCFLSSAGNNLNLYKIFSGLKKKKKSGKFCFWFCQSSLSARFPLRNKFVKGLLSDLVQSVSIYFNLF